MIYNLFNERAMGIGYDQRSMGFTSIRVEIGVAKCTSTTRETRRIYGFRVLDECHGVSDG